MVLSEDGPGEVALCSVVILLPGQAILANSLAARLFLQTIQAGLR